MPYALLEDRRRVKREWARRQWRANPEAVNTVKRRFMDARRQDVKAAKLERGCANCGYRENADALEFDHIIPVRVTRHKPYRWMNSKQELTNALADPNIQVLCANCHAIKSVGERLRTWQRS